MTIKFGHFGKFSGPYSLGTVQYTLPDDRKSYHVDRAYWLTTMVETGGKFGSVNAYDGTGMTAGLDQHIAVYPSELVHEDFNAENDQGSLWELLRRIETVNGSTSFQAAFAAISDGLKAQNMYLSQDGRVRYLENGTVGFSGGFQVLKAGDLAFGQHLRNVLTPPNGVVPNSGPDWEIAKAWATQFSELFSHPDSFKAQTEFGKEHLVNRTKTWKVKGQTLEQALYGQEITNAQLPPALDLALSVFQSHSVNAPGAATRLLPLVLVEPSNQAFPRNLLRILGQSTYGQWNQRDPSSRYQRTRTIAQSSGLWPTELFNTIMPKVLV